MAHDGLELVELSIHHTDVEANMLAARLKDAGIEARVFSTASDVLGFMSDTTFPHGGAQVRVTETDLERAKPILAEFLAEDRSAEAGD